MKRVGQNGRLVAFCKAVGVYFLVGSGGAPSLQTAVLKCAPVLFLVACVGLGGRGEYARRVAVGLALSCVGDALLVWPACFVGGMCAFGGAHVAYLAAFGWRPLRAVAALLIYACTLLYLRTLSPPPGLRVLLPAYALLLATMAWRGAARAGSQRPGALLFLLSDAILGYSLFGGDVPYKQVLVMSTYYLGQLLIASSALQPPAGGSAVTVTSSPHPCSALARD
ncbi:lysoplasmalogenase isoform X2 [Leptidea sinapis]|nr:lysoplasmalogenase isoform X2 [Leptidea sinapis]